MVAVKIIKIGSVECYNELWKIMKLYNGREGFIGLIT